MRTQGRIRSSTLRDLASGVGQSVGRAAPDVSVPVTPPLIPQWGPQDLRLGSVTSGHLALSGSGGQNLGGVSFTSADTTQWLGAVAVTVTVQDTHAFIFMPMSFHMKHTAPNAIVGAELLGYSAGDGTGTGTVGSFWLADNIIMPATANNWKVFTPTGVGGKLDDAAYGPWALGTHYILLAVRNYTAGTLTVVQPNDDLFGYFVLGSS